MKRGIFIQANSKQLFGAKIAKFAMETRGKARGHGIPVTIMNVEENPTYMKYVGMTYKRGKETRTHDPSDLQFFTLSRFMPPELMGYEGEAVVIDPDIFALSDIQELFSFERSGAPIAACKRKNDVGWDSSVMVLECNKLHHWSIERILENLKQGVDDYRDWARLTKEHVSELPRVFNSIDVLADDTKLIHMSHRLTQPWKTGLPIDFSYGETPKLFGVIPRFWVSHPTHYEKHPDKNIEALFLSILNEAVRSGAVSLDDIDNEVRLGNIRGDIRNLVTPL